VTNANESFVYVIDDDEAVRDSLTMLLESAGLACEAFASAFDFLEAYDPERLACIVSDIRMPGMNGLELQERMLESGIDAPLIFITGHGDVPMAVTAMKRGAVDFIQKPFSDQELLDRIHQVLEQEKGRRAARLEEKVILERLKTLTPRETEVMERVVRGQANKVIAMDLGVSQRTVELHRARVMRKLRMRSLAELVQAVNRVRNSSKPSDGPEKAGSDKPETSAKSR